MFSYNSVEIYWEVSNSFSSDASLWSWACSVVRKTCQGEGAQMQLWCQMFGCCAGAHPSPLTAFAPAVTTHPLLLTHPCKLIVHGQGATVTQTVPTPGRESPALTASRLVAEARRKEESLLGSCCQGALVWREHGDHQWRQLTLDLLNREGQSNTQFGGTRSANVLPFAADLNSPLHTGGLQQHQLWGFIFITKHFTWMAWTQNKPKCFTEAYLYPT